MLQIRHQVSLVSVVFLVFISHWLLNVAYMLTIRLSKVLDTSCSGVHFNCVSRYVTI